MVSTRKRRRCGSRPYRHGQWRRHRHRRSRRCAVQRQRLVCRVANLPERGMKAIGRVLALVVLTPIVVLVAGIGGCEARKAYYDRQVRKMCEKDGGVVLSGYVQLTSAQAQQLSKVGSFISIPTERLARGDEPAFTRHTESVLRDANPRLTRWEEIIYRRADMKEVGRIVRFRRAGGDFPTLAMPSSFNCPDEDKVLSQRQAVFRVQP